MPRAKYCARNEGADERPGFRHELASALGLFSLLKMFDPKHEALLGPWIEVLNELKLAHMEQVEQPAPPHIQPLLSCTAEQFNLLAYLVASHHGKVRVGLHAAPQDQDYRAIDDHGLPIRGVREHDKLPGVALLPNEPPLPEVSLTLEPAKLGLSSRTGISWRERCIGLLQQHGPATLAYLEAILRAADVRASQSTTPDPALVTEGNT